MIWLDAKYLSLLSGRLRNFKRKSATLYNFSCPVCGDSASDLRKARGYAYQKKDDLVFHCHNCGVTMTVRSLIKKLDVGLYSEYNLERLRESGRPSRNTELDEFVAKMKPPEFRKSGPLAGLPKVSQLDPDDDVKRLVVSRKIPTPFHAKLFKTDAFKKFTNSLVSGKFDSTGRDEARLIIPFVDKSGNVHAYQGRSIGPSKVKYITIVLDESVPKVFGIDTVDPTKRVYSFEGPIDAMFVPNSIATAGGDITAATKVVPKSNLVIVYDNEPRSPQTVAKMEKAISAGFTVCVWPSWVTEKDVNDMILADRTPEEIRSLIDANARSGLAATAALSSWRKDR